MSDELKEVAVTQSALPALPVLSEEGLQEIMEANFGETLQPSFPKIKIPAGAGLAWEIPTDKEEPDSAKELIGTILDHYRTRAYWPGEYSGGNSPPECSSMNAIKGTKYGLCKECQFSQWGSGKDGRGQACKLTHRVYLLLKDSGSILPYLLSLAPTSSPEKNGYVGSLPTFATNMMGKLKKLHDITVKVKLVKDWSSDKKYEFSKAQFFYVADLNEQDKATAKFLRERLASAMREVPIEEDHNAGNGNGGNGAPSGGTDPWDSPEYKK